MTIQIPHLQLLTMKVWVGEGEGMVGFVQLIGCVQGPSLTSDLKVVSEPLWAWNSTHDCCTSWLGTFHYHPSIVSVCLKGKGPQTLTVLSVKRG